MVLTQAEESADADAALVMPGGETDVAALGTGKGGVALPKAFPNADLIAVQAKDPECLRYMQLVNKPRAQWPPHLAAAPIQFLYVRRSRVWQVGLGAMCWARRGGVCVSVTLGIACGVAVLGCRWPGQPRLPRDPPYAKEYEVRIDCTCAA